MAGGAKGVAHDLRHVSRSGWRKGVAADRRLGLFLLALFALFAAAGAGARRQRERPGVTAHDHVGDVVGFALFGIVGVTDGEFGLKEARAEELLDGLISGLLLQLLERRGLRSNRGHARGVTGSGRAVLVLLRDFRYAFQVAAFLRFLRSCPSFRSKPSPRFRPVLSKLSHQAEARSKS